MRGRLRHGAMWPRGERGRAMVALAAGVLVLAAAQAWLVPVGAHAAAKTDQPAPAHGSSGDDGGKLELRTPALLTPTGARLDWSGDGALARQLEIHRSSLP